MANETMNIAATGPRPSDKWIPWYFVLFFVVVFAVNGVFVYFALDTFNGVTEDHYYEHGLTYNTTLKAEYEQEELGWSAGLTTAVTGPTSADIALAVQDADGAAISGADVKVVLIRPVTAGHDFYADLQESATPGTYTAHIDFPLPGQWDVQLHVHHDGHAFQQTRRVFIEQ